MAKELWKGNEAIAEAAIRGGCECFFGYPITPQSEVPEYMSVHLPAAGGVFVQSESEVAAINMVYGAAGTGKRTMTSSSSPGISLKQEGITYLAAAELPCADPPHAHSVNPSIAAVTSANVFLYFIIFLLLFSYLMIWYFMVIYTFVSFRFFVFFFVFCFP